MRGCPALLLAAVVAAAPRPSRRSTAAAAAATAFRFLLWPVILVSPLGWQDVADTVELMNQLDTDQSETISWQEWSHGCAQWLNQMEVPGAV